MKRNMIKALSLLLSLCLLAGLLPAAALADGAGGTTISSGDTIAVSLSAGEEASYSLNAQAGQDVKIEISNFNAVYVRIIAGETTLTVEQDGTYYLHLGKSWNGNITMEDYWKASEGSAMNATFTVLDGDTNEPNDSKEQAKSLTTGTSAAFSIGGCGDEDWFSFQSDGSTYKLTFQGMNTDYSDSFQYTIYDADGEALVSNAAQYNHTRDLGTCPEGTYYICVTDDGENLSRSSLTLQVDTGSDDLHEINDDWEHAADAAIDTEIKYTLTSIEDEDWFRIVTTEPNLTLAMEQDSSIRYELYSEQIIAQEDMWRYKDGDNYTSGSMSTGTVYYKLKEAGTYYLRLYATTTAYLSSAVRTMTLSLEEPEAIEPNDTWKQATALTLDQETTFALSAENDVDWFKLEVPADTEKLLVSVGNGESNPYDSEMYYSLYREADFLAYGDDANYISDAIAYSGSRLKLEAPAAGTYYVKCEGFFDGDERCADAKISYSFTALEPNENTDEDNPKALTVGTPEAYYFEYRNYYYYSVTFSEQDVGKWVTLSGLDITGNISFELGKKGYTAPFEITQAGTYLLYIYNRTDEAIGSFTLSLLDKNPDVYEPDTDGNVAYSLEAYDKIYISVPVTAGQYVSVSGFPEDYDFGVSSGSYTKMSNTLYKSTADGKLLFYYRVYDDCTGTLNFAVSDKNPLAITMTDGASLEYSGNQYYYIEVTLNQGQYLTFEGLPSDYNLYNDSDWTSEQLIGYNNDAGRYFVCKEDGTFGFKYRSYDGSGTLTARITTIRPGATVVTSGEEIQVSFPGLTGWTNQYYAIQMTAGQDLQLDISNFDSDSNLYVYDANTDTRLFYTSTNGTYYIHAAKSGYYNLWLHGYDTTFTMKLAVLEAAANEPANDSKENAILLNPDTDYYFSNGGSGDQDWYCFDPSVGTQQYTLQFLDMNQDYSDAFTYTIYAPDGTEVRSDVSVSYNTSVDFGCDQIGRYYICLHGGCLSTNRQVRFRLVEGGPDANEPNDTAEQATVIDPDETVNYSIANSSGDTDWFKIHVPKDYMTFESTQSGTLYDGNLKEVGSGKYIQLTEDGNYYFCITASTDSVQSFSIHLREQEKDEPNDTRQTATPLYEDVPYTFNRVTDSDVDWFTFTVPEGTATLTLNWTDRYDYLKIYREQDFEKVGDNASWIYCHEYYDSGFMYSIQDPEPGIYYVKSYSGWYGGRILGQTFTYHLTMEDEVLPDHSTMDTALTGTAGTWIEGSGDMYISLGELSAGSTVRLSLDDLNESVYRIYLVDGEGDSYGTCYGGYNSSSYCGNEYSFYVGSANSYYLQIDDRSSKSYRIRYDIGTTDDAITEIEGPTEYWLTVGELAKLDLRLKPYDAKGPTSKTYLYTLSSDNTSVANCYGSTQNACVEGIASGDATITVTYKGDTSIKKEITVHVLPEGTTNATGITITGAPEGKMALGEKATLTASLTGGSGGKITWTSSDPSILYVDEKGVVTAVGKGSATITASAGTNTETAEEIKAEVIITTKDAPTVVAVTGIDLSAYGMQLYMGEGTKALTATVRPENAANKTVTWSSSDTAVATVLDGVVTPVGPGVAIITATAGGYHVSCAVTVYAARTRVTGVSLDKTELSIALGSTSSVTATVAPTDATTKTILWSSEHPDVATVSRTGYITGVSVGTTTITAATADGNFTATVTVTVTAAPQTGDVNGDGYINSGDALLILRASVGLTELDEAEKTAADVNNDGRVDAGDAVLVLRYAAGLITSL